jgi:hypothetical protein
MHADVRHDTLAPASTMTRIVLLPFHSSGGRPVHEHDEQFADEDRR